MQDKAPGLCTKWMSKLQRKQGGWFKMSHQTQREGQLFISLTFDGLNNFCTPQEGIIPPPYFYKISKEVS